MSADLTFGDISALFGLTNHIIDQQRYTILLTAVIGSAVVPTLIARRWFMPVYRPIETVEAEPSGARVRPGPVAMVTVEPHNSPCAPSMLRVFCG